jgi:hypothetical protein
VPEPRKDLLGAEKLGFSNEVRQPDDASGKVRIDGFKQIDETFSQIEQDRMVKTQALSLSSV